MRPNQCHGGSRHVGALDKTSADHDTVAAFDTADIGLHDDLLQRVVVTCCVGGGNLRASD